MMERLVYKCEDAIGPLEVWDEGGVRTLRFGTSVIQSSAYLDGHNPLKLRYTQALMLSLLFIPDPKSALLLGMGAGSVARFLWRAFEACEIQGVELRQAAIDAGHQYFELPNDPRLKIHIGRAEEFLEIDTAEYHLICVDLFGESSMSSAVAHESFFRCCSKRLAEGAVLCWNLWSDAPAERLKQSLGGLRKELGQNLLLLGVSPEQAVAIALPKPYASYADLAKRAQALQERTKAPLADLWRQFQDHSLPFASLA